MTIKVSFIIISVLISIFMNFKCGQFISFLLNITNLGVIYLYRF